MWKACVKPPEEEQEKAGETGVSECFKVTLDLSCLFQATSVILNNLML
jgi:hypothetical protein